MKQRGFAPVLIILVIAIIGIAGYFGYKYFYKSPFKSPACTLEAKICPDGSSVGRTGPNCEFAACPSPSADLTAGWNDYKNNIYGIEFKVPADWKVEGGGGGEDIRISPMQTGSQVYDANFTLVDNPDKLSADAFVTKTINDSKDRPGAPLTFGSKENITLAGKPAMVLHSVFAFDKSLEEVFVANGAKIMLISYPSNSENPNLFEPVKNYAIVQEILSTLKFLK